MCILQKRGCATDCIFLEYFPNTRLKEFKIAYQLYGSRNIKKMVELVDPNLRKQAAETIMDEATGWAHDHYTACRLASDDDMSKLIEMHQRNLATDLKAVEMNQLPFVVGPGIDSSLQQASSEMDLDLNLSLGRNYSVPFSSSITEKGECSSRRKDDE
ncbi:Lateral organ boundaries, LOB [Dillenia turbinata]|uniref:Lateral organ boundaries, LOB n=1 Tax=Dillenia turbinata TaxID=194707 RepID=A0AAN8ZKN9_9MAGN